MNEKIIEGTVKSWGLRVAVPAPILKNIGVSVGDEVIWTLEERDGKTVAVLSKKESVEDDLFR